jgi:hypothetical protein
VINAKDNKDKQNQSPSAPPTFSQSVTTSAGGTPAQPQDWTEGDAVGKGGERIGELRWAASVTDWSLPHTLAPVTEWSPPHTATPSARSYDETWQ